MPRNWIEWGAAATVGMRSAISTAPEGIVVLAEQLS
jgi:hypothetical protein